VCGKTIVIMQGGVKICGVIAEGNQEITRGDAEAAARTY
jgi:hypothetical protein